MRGIILLVVGFVGLYYYRLVRASKTLSFSAGIPKNISVKSGMLSWTQPINIVNGDITPIPISSVSLTNSIYTKNALGIDQEKVYGQTLLLSPIILQGQQTTVMNLFVSIPYTDLLFLGIDLINLIKQGVAKLRFKGVLNAVGVTIPIDQKIEIPLNI